MNRPLQERYDVVVLGGAFSGASTAMLLKRDHPEFSVLVVEKSKQFDAKVGEATTEMSAMFLTRRLAQWRHLELDQLPKEGLRYWFANADVQHHWQATEAGGFVRSAVPSFQLRRDVLDQHLLDEAVAAGAELVRPARVREVELGKFDHRVTIDQGSDTFTVGCRWVIDATGRGTLLGRQLGLITKNEQHPTAAFWGRFRNLGHIDDLAARGPVEWARRNVSSRRLGTNHYTGRGYWVWVIPHGHGETSVGVVWDRRLLDLHTRTDREQAFRDFLAELVPFNELLPGAELRTEDFRYYSNLPYATTQYMGEGWALVGDAAVFLDPYYSPGLDHCAFSVEATAEIVAIDLAGKPIVARTKEHNETFVRSYWRFFEAIYRDKYYYMGEADLLSAAFLLDTAQYYIFVVIPAYRVYGRFFWMPVLGPKEAYFNYRLMMFYNRRFKALAELRHEMGEAGKRNAGRRIKAYFALDTAPFRMALRGVKLWLYAELDGLRLGLKKLFRGKPAASVPPMPAAATEDR
ncbi:MAG: NAD(P)/FAD-dependent oxidoreductase [Thermoanaerobaculia bacterium]|jgi:flavin-dependent dehydrogenase|nr:NAD(P)/FAD-dependent oxidoreductase [Thermoanaerobaculia bacterium]MBP9825506.1 NAD(P)/FAD-dependent oxidoreductase [Thermoanaerobaculia bacterium]